MPVRRKGEKLTKYVSRCVSARQREHPDEPIKRSVAACYSMGRTFWRPKRKTVPTGTYKTKPVRRGRKRRTR